MRLTGVTLNPGNQATKIQVSSSCQHFRLPLQSNKKHESVGDNSPTYFRRGWTALWKYLLCPDWQVKEDRLDEFGSAAAWPSDSWCWVRALGMVG